MAGFLILNPFQGSGEVKESLLTAKVQQGTVSTTITATGSVQPLREVAASFSVSGTIASINVSVGDQVAAGQELASLSTASFDAQVAAARSSLSIAQSNLTLANQNLAEVTASGGSGGNGGNGGNGSADSGSITSAQQQVNSAKNAVTNASSSLTEAQSNLSATKLVAPIAGLVIAVNGTAGDSSGGGGGSGGNSGSNGLVTIADTSGHIVTAYIAEADIASVSVGQSAQVTFPAMPDASATAKITAISPTATSSNSVVTYATTITLDSVPDNLRLGQTADITITTASSADDALYVPNAAVKETDGAKTVQVVADDGTTTTVTVETGVVGDAGTEITSGLEVGQTVVIGTVSEETSTSNQNGGLGGFGGFGDRGGRGGSGGTGGQGNFGGFGGGNPEGNQNQQGGNG